MVYLAFTTVLPLTTRSTGPGTTLRDVYRLGWDLGNVELGVHGRMIRVMLGELLRALRATIYCASVDRDAVRATSLLRTLTHTRRLHECRGGDSMTRVGR